MATFGEAAPDSSIFKKVAASIQIVSTNFSALQTGFLIIISIYDDMFIK